MRTLLLLFFGLIFFCPRSVNGQEREDEFFHELEITYPFLKKEKWQGKASANWKHIYDEIGWRRWGIDATISRSIKFLRLEAGITANYTFDKEIINYTEVRPWIGIRSDLQLSERLLFMQKVKVESRQFFYEEVYANEQRIRSRLLLAMKYDLLDEREDWKLNPTGEWYFVGRNADAERFVNSVEFGLRLIKVFPNDHELAFGYKIESYKKSNVENNTKRGHIFVLEYGF